jgi:hypothetical protein
MSTADCRACLSVGASAQQKYFPGIDLTDFIITKCYPVNAISVFAVLNDDPVRAQFIDL